MQAELNAAVLFDQDQKWIFVGSYGHAPIPFRLERPTAAANERMDFARALCPLVASEKNWIYAGMMDKVYGLRIVNHTAYSRQRVGVAMNDKHTRDDPSYRAEVGVVESPLRRKSLSGE